VIERLEALGWNLREPRGGDPGQAYYALMDAEGKAPAEITGLLTLDRLEQLLDDGTVPRRVT
jgi:hypothetical protein